MLVLVLMLVFGYRYPQAQADAIDSAASTHHFFLCRRPRLARLTAVVQITVPKPRLSQSSILYAQACQGQQGYCLTKGLPWQRDEVSAPRII